MYRERTTKNKKKILLYVLAGKERLVDNAVLKIGVFT